MMSENIAMARFRHAVSGVLIHVDVEYAESLGQDWVLVDADATEPELAEEPVETSEVEATEPDLVEEPVKSKKKSKRGSSHTGKDKATGGSGEQW